MLKGRPLFKRERAEGEKKDKKKKEALSVFFVVSDKNMGQNEGMCEVRKSILEQRMAR